MNKKPEDVLAVAGIDDNLINRLSDYNKKIASGEEVNPEIKRAVEVINITSQIMNSINSGVQIDPVYFKNLALEFGAGKVTPDLKSEKKVRKKKKLNIKSK